MDGIENKSENDMLNIDAEKKIEGGEHDELKDRTNEACEYNFGKESCKCVEEYKKHANADTIILPSIVTDREEIYFPENITNDDPSIYGKWLIFTNGDLFLQNHLWIQLQILIKNGDLILLASSTAKMCEERDRFQGVIKCYTCKDINVIRHAGLALQNILKDDTILDYKTNEASQNNLFRANGNRFITKFMLTVNGKLYRRDKLCRWAQITDAEYHNFTFEEEDSEHYSPATKKTRIESETTFVFNLLPSLEARKKKRKYAYPEDSFVNPLSYHWCLFCNVADADGRGLTELDRAWFEARNLCDEKIFLRVTCETYAYKHFSNATLSRRTLMAEMNENNDIDHFIKCADKLRERISYNRPMYCKSVLNYGNRKPEYKLMYLYTEEGELYEYDMLKWRLLKRV